MNKLVAIVVFLTSCCYASVDQFSTFLSRAVHSGEWEEGCLNLFVDDFTKAIEQNPYDYESRICRVLASGLTLAENVEMQKILSSFGFAIDFEKCSLIGETFPASKWAKVNDISDAMLAQSKPVFKQIFEDLCAIPESWGGLSLNPNKWPVDEAVTIDYADVQYIKAQCWAALGLLHFVGAYDIDVDYEKAEHLLTSHDPLLAVNPRIPVLSKRPNLTSDSGWDNAAIVAVSENEYFNAFRIAFADDKMYVRLVLKPGAKLPEDVAYEFMVELMGDKNKGFVYFDPYDTHMGSDIKSWWWDWDWDNSYNLEFYDEGKTLVFDLPEEVLANKETFFVEWMEVSIVIPETHIEYDEYWDEEWIWVSWESLDSADSEDFISSFWHFVVDQKGIFGKVRNKNNLIYAREYFRLSLEQMKVAFAADEKRKGSNLRLIECCALEDYKYIKDRIHKYINRAIESLESVTTVDLDDFNYSKSPNEIEYSEIADKLIKLNGNNSVFSISLAPLFNGLEPRAYMPSLSLGQYFSSVSIDISKMKDPTLAGILPWATDSFWYGLAHGGTAQFYYIGTPRNSVMPSVIPVNKFKPSDLIGVSNGYVLFDEVTDNVPESMASVYEGFLSDKDGNCCGSIQLKVASPKQGSAKVVATIQIINDKKISLKGVLNTSNGHLEITGKDGRVLSLRFGLNAVSGTFGMYDIDGARNFFESKDKREKSTAEEMLKPYLGAYSMVFEGGNLAITIAKKGKVTVKGAIDGNKVSAKAQALIGADVICIPVVYSKKSVNLAFTIWLPLDGGEAEVIGLDNANIGKAGTLKDGAKFIIDGDIGASIETEDSRTLELLPNNETITVSKSKWLVAGGIKAAKVAYKKGEFTITEGKKGAGIVNPSGLKLSYKSKDGSFTGSFTAYAIVKGKLKKHKATVEGVLVNGVGYGTIIIKKIGTWAVTIE